MKKYRMGLFMMAFAALLLAGCGRSEGVTESGTAGQGTENAGVTAAGTGMAKEPVPGTVEMSTGAEGAVPGIAGADSGMTGAVPGIVSPASGTSAEEPGVREESVTARFEIMEAREDGLLVLGLDEIKGLYHVGHGAVIKDVDGGALAVSDLKAEEIVELTWNGAVMETYPGQFGYDELKKTGETGSSSFLFYRKLLKELAETDPGLNDGVNLGYFDFTGITSLSEGEKEGLAYLAGSDYSAMGTQSTEAELKAEGILDEEKGIEYGILVTVEETSFKEDSITCNAKKYRSGTGAYYFQNVKAEYKNGEWEYKIGDHMIS